MRGVLVLAVLVLGGCSRETRDAAQPAADTSAASQGTPAAKPGESTRPKIVVLGDSLTARLGLAPSAGPLSLRLAGSQSTTPQRRVRVGDSLVALVGALRIIHQAI